MKIEKNKIVFAAVIICVVLFIGAYSMMMLGENDEAMIKNNQVPVPKLEDEQKEYWSKLEALDALKEVRETNAPSIYDERFLDSSGVFDPDFLDYEKMRIVDSIYNEGRINYSKQDYRSYETPKSEDVFNLVKDSEVDTKITVDFNKSHSSFFEFSKVDQSLSYTNTDSLIYVAVNGTQVVKKDFRLELQLTQPAVVSGRKLPKHTLLYGFVSFKPNRVMVHVTNIQHEVISLKAFDMQDGNEGIYVLNNFRSEASNAIVDDAIDQINIPAVPSAGVLKKVFQRSNRHTKATITNNYSLILKPKL